MKEITTRGQKVMMPECIDELTPEQYKYYLFVASAYASKIISLEYFRVRWFSYLLGMGDGDFTILKQEYIDEILPIVEPLVAGYLYREGDQVLPVLSSCRNLLPFYKGHVGPGHWLNGMTFGQVVECVTEMERAWESESPESWEHIARVMYGYTEAEPVDDILVQHAATFFTSVWKAITSGPIEINGKMIDFSIIFKGASYSRRADDKTGWTGITFEVASAGLFGPVKDVEAADFWAVLMYLYKCKFEYNHEQHRNL